MVYTLKNSRFTASFDTHCGEIVSLKDLSSGTEYIWQGDEKYWSSHAPICFPIVGGLRDNKAIIGGNKTCCMERHGLSRKADFTFKDKTENSVSFFLSSDEETKKRYPYDFELIVRYILDNEGVQVEFTAVNKSGEKMPYQIGGHPAFRCPIFDGENFEDYVVEFEKTETADCYTPVPETGLLDAKKTTRYLDNTNTLKLSHDLFRVDAIVFDKLKSKSAKLYNPATGRGVKLDFKEFDDLLVWSSKNDGPFVALEPWNGLSTCSDEGDIFEEKRGVRIIPAGGKNTVSFKIIIITK